MRFNLTFDFAAVPAKPRSWIKTRRLFGVQLALSLTQLETVSYQHGAGRSLETSPAIVSEAFTILQNRFSIYICTYNVHACD